MEYEKTQCSIKIKYIGCSDIEILLESCTMFNCIAMSQWKRQGVLVLASDDVSSIWNTSWRGG